MSLKVTTIARLCCCSFSKPNDGIKRSNVELRFYFWEQNIWVHIIHTSLSTIANEFNDQDHANGPKRLVILSFIEFFFVWHVKNLRFTIISINTDDDRLVVTFQRVIAEADPVACDDTSLCDLYIKLFIDDKIVCESSMHSESTFPVFMKTCTSWMIQKYTSFRVEIWDWDNFLRGGDDKMAYFDGTIDNLLSTTEKSISNPKFIIQWMAFWKPK